MATSRFTKERLAFSGSVERRVKLDHYVALRFDRFVIDQCGLKAPFANGLDDSGEEVWLTKDGPHVSDAAIFGNSGLDAY